MKKRALIITFKDFNKNLRGIKQIELLKDNYEIDYAGYSALESKNNFNFLKIDPKFRNFGFPQKAVAFLLLLFKKHTLAFKKMYDCENILKAIKYNQYDLIISHDLKPLAILFDDNFDLFNTKVLLDAHEYYKGVGSGILHKLVFRSFNMSFYKYISKVDHINTVNESIAILYQDEFPEVKVSYTFNVPPYKEIEPKAVDKEKVRMIHHGYANPSRKLELMIETMTYLDKRFYLDLMLVSLSMEDRYIEKLKRKAKSLPNVRFINPVKPHQIIDFIKDYDIGIFILPETTMSLKLALPNKLFDFIQARLMVVIGPSIEMAKIVKNYNLGIVSDTFNPEKIAVDINRLNVKQLFLFKRNAHKAARELNSSTQLKELKVIIENL